MPSIAISTISQHALRGEAIDIDRSGNPTREGFNNGVLTREEYLSFPNNTPEGWTRFIASTGANNALRTLSILPDSLAAATSLFTIFASTMAPEIVGNISAFAGAVTSAVGLTALSAGQHVYETWDIPTSWTNSSIDTGFLALEHFVGAAVSAAGMVMMALPTPTSAICGLGVILAGGPLASSATHNILNKIFL